MSKTKTVRVRQEKSVGQRFVLTSINRVTALAILILILYIINTQL